MRYLPILLPALGLFAAPLAMGQDATPAATASPAAHEPESIKVIMQTELGAIVLAIEKERAPITAGNFLRYVDQKRLDGVVFYRAMKIDDTEYALVQGGLRGNPKLVLKPIAHEPTSVTSLSHVSGAISMARGAPGTATADFFIVVGDLVTLDAQPVEQDPLGEMPGYAVFGRVIEGMDTVKSMLELPRSATAGEGAMKGQMLEIPVKILTVRRAP